MTFAAAFIDHHGPIRVVESMPHHLFTWLHAHARVVAKHDFWSLRIMDTQCSDTESMENHRAAGIAAAMGSQGNILQGPCLLVTSYGTVEDGTLMFDETVEATLAQWAEGGWDVLSHPTVQDEDFAAWFKTSPWRELW